MTKKRWRPRQWMEMSSFLTWQAPGLIYYSTTKHMKWWSAYGYLSVRCHFQTSTWNRHRSMLVTFSSPIGSNFCSPLPHVPYSFQFSPFYILSNLIFYSFYYTPLPFYIRIKINWSFYWFHLIIWFISCPLFAQRTSLREWGPEHGKDISFGHWSCQWKTGTHSIAWGDRQHWGRQCLRLI